MKIMEVKVNDEMVIKSKGSKFIGEFLEDLPDNVMLNKVTTGSGMTSLVLANPIKYVLVVPYTALISNKAKWCKERNIELCAVYYGGADEDEIQAFMGDKIITTYDSLDKVTKVLEKRGDIKEWKVCIDEAHKLVDSAAFRPKAINSVLNNYNKYKSYVFGTATPVKDKHQLPKLRNIKKVGIQWDSLTPVKVNYCHYERGINDVTAIIALGFINGERSGNAHIFVNSVSSIISVIKKLVGAGITDAKDIRIVCANNSRNQNLIDAELPGEFHISPVGSKVRKVNFYTATAFEGCDIYDEDGKSYIITDGSKDYTKIDIVTVLPQIIGRVRNSKFKNRVSLNYTSNQYINNLSESEFEERVRFNLKKAEKTVKKYKLVKDDPTIRNTLLENLNDSYLIVDGDEIKVNENAWYNEMHNFTTINSTYYVSKDGTDSTIQDGTVINNGIDYNYEGFERISIKGLNKIKLGKKASFKDLCLDFIRVYKEKPSLSRSGKLAELDKCEPLLSIAFHKLGAEKMKALEYRKSKINDALLSISNKYNNSYKIVKFLGFRTGEWISKSDIKTRLKEAYKKLDITSAAKATDIVKWYDIKPKNKSKNGKSVSGFLIGTCKIKTT
ncbi:hypothetical protein MWU50_07505 [Flavobacteriaceae bacterium S0862]|nr:hypothetical protein [Flavobacteriaceae bacterium S0862]